MLGNLPRHLIDCGKIGFAGFFWWRAYANENGISRADGLACIRSIGNAASLACCCQYFSQVLLVNGHLSVLQTLDSIGIDVRAGHFMSGRGQACSGYQSNVATSNHREMQVRIS